MRDKDDDLAMQNTIGEETGRKGKLVGVARTSSTSRPYASSSARSPSTMKRSAVCKIEVSTACDDTAAKKKERAWDLCENSCSRPGRPPRRLPQNPTLGRLG